MIEPLTAAVATVGLGVVGYWLGYRTAPNGESACGAHDWEPKNWLDIRRDGDVFDATPTRDYRGITSADVQWPVAVSRKRVYRCERCGDTKTKYETFAKIDEDGRLYDQDQ
jgi:hypothetical protein